MNCHKPNINNQLSLVTTTKMDAAGNARYDQVVIEEPLRITLHWQQQSAVFTITMRTPGDDNLLALGLLYSEGLIKKADDIADIRYEQNQHGEMPNHLQVFYQPGLAPDLSDSHRQLISQSSCGICGKTSLKTLELNTDIQLSEQKHWLDKLQLTQLPDKLRANQPLFEHCGGTHGAALFDGQYQLIDCKEDIGRHNALDKLIGANLRRTKIPQENILVLSGRVSFELVQKAIVAGYPVLVAVGAPSSLAIDAAKRFNITLVGFTKTNGFNVYTGQWRFNTQNKE